MVMFSEEISGKLYVPDRWKDEPSIDLVIHFHGDSRVAQDAVDRQERAWMLFHCHWGGGSSAYSRPVEAIGPAVFLDTIFAAVRHILPQAQVGGVYLSGWSAGYGAVRSLIREEEAARRVDGLLLMDGLHCSYVPEGRPLSAGGALDSVQTAPFLRWAELAASGQKSFLITHSSVFPGTYASTTETAEYLLQSLSLSRQSLLAEGPVGMQQTSVAVRGKLQVLSFAGNSAPDHVDHYYGMGVFFYRMEVE
jgi:hypothetical protein